MANTQVAKRYAKALFQLAKEQGRLDAVKADLDQLAGLMKNSPDFATLVRPYAFSVEHRRHLYRTALEGRVDPLVLRFLEFLAEKGRSQHLGAIIESFARLFNESKGILAVRIVSAQALDARQVEDIKQRLKARLHKDIAATVEVDASLIGGFQVRVGDLVYDYSIHHQLDMFHRKLVTV